MSTSPFAGQLVKLMTCFSLLVRASLVWAEGPSLEETVKWINEEFARSTVTINHAVCVTERITYSNLEVANGLISVVETVKRGASSCPSSTSIYRMSIHSVDLESITARTKTNYGTGSLDLECHNEQECVTESKVSIRTTGERQELAHAKAFLYFKVPPDPERLAKLVRAFRNLLSTARSQQGRDPF